MGKREAGVEGWIVCKHFGVVCGLVLVMINGIFIGSCYVPTEYE